MFCVTKVVDFLLGYLTRLGSRLDSNKYETTIDQSSVQKTAAPFIEHVPVELCAQITEGFKILN